MEEEGSLLEGEWIGGGVDRPPTGVVALRRCLVPKAVEEEGSWRGGRVGGRCGVVQRGSGWEGRMRSEDASLLAFGGGGVMLGFVSPPSLPPFSRS